MNVHLDKAFTKNVNVSAGKKSEVFRDTELAGFGLQVTANGVKTFVVTLRDGDGKRRQERIADVSEMSVSKARSKAYKRICEARDLRERNGVVRARSVKMFPTLHDYFYEVHLPYLRLNIQSADTYASYFKNHILPVLGSRRLNEIDVADLNGLKQVLLHKKVWGGKFDSTGERCLGNSTIKKIFKILSALFNAAIEFEKIPLIRNPVKKVKIKPDKVQFKGKRLKSDEVTALINACRRSRNKSLFDVVTVALSTGLRKSNVLGLEWSRIDFEQGTIFIPAEQSKSRREFTIALADDLLVRLRAMYEQRAHDRWVFINPQTNLPFGNVRNSFKTACKRAGIDEARIHDMRHSFASAMLEAGATLEEVRDALAHQDIRTTALYVQASEERKKLIALNTVQALGIFTTQPFPQSRV